MKKVITVLGMPRSGKDTHAKLLSEKLGYKYFSVSDVISEEIKNKTKIGLIMERYSDSYTKEPDEYLIMLVKDAIINLKEDGIVFNGFPRNLNQAKALDSFLFLKKISRPTPIILETENIVILERMPEISSNDSFFKTSVNLYEKTVKPIEKYYGGIGLKFNTTEKTPEKINEEILDSIKKI